MLSVPTPKKHVLRRHEPGRIRQSGSVVIVHSGLDPMYSCQPHILFARVLGPSSLQFGAARPAFCTEVIDWS